MWVLSKVIDMGRALPLRSPPLLCIHSTDDAPPPPPHTLTLIHPYHIISSLDHTQGFYSDFRLVPGGASLWLHVVKGELVRWHVLIERIEMDKWAGGCTHMHGSHLPLPRLPLTYTRLPTQQTLLLLPPTAANLSLLEEWLAMPLEEEGEGGGKGQGGRMEQFLPLRGGWVGMICYIME